MRKVVAPLGLMACVILIVGACISISQAKTATDQGDFSDIDTYVESQIATYHIPGLALAIIQGDQIVYMRGYGVANPSGQPVTPKTSFITGSIGKSITATAMMMLVEAGKVDLDAPVQQYLPWFQVADAQASAKITIRMLLTHTSGIPNGAGWPSQAHSDLSESALERLVRSFSSVKLTHEPGKFFEYANANYQIVGMVIQAVSGQSFQSFIQENIYTPLDMRNSYTSRDEARQHGMARGYRYWFGYPIPANNLPFSYGQFPAGWYICSAEDLANYLILHMNEGTYGGKTLISAGGMAELHRPYLNNYAMGWVVEGSLISHNGGVPDYGTGLYFNTRTHYGVVVAFNANTGYFYSPAYVIAPSILHMVDGGQPVQPVPDTWYSFMLIGLAVTLAIQGIWIFLSARILRHWHRSNDKRPRSLVGRVLWIVLPMIIEAGLAIYIVSTLQANGRTVLVDFIYQPDVSLLAIISLTMAAGWGLLRTILSLTMFARHST